MINDYNTLHILNESISIFYFTIMNKTKKDIDQMGLTF